MAWLPPGGAAFELPGRAGLAQAHARPPLALPLGPGLLDPGWLEAQGLELHPDQQPLLEQLWLLLPEGRVRSSREARHLIRTCGYGWRRWVSCCWAQVSWLTRRTTRSTGRPDRQSLGGLAPKTMHPGHRYSVMVMEIDRRLLSFGCRTTQTGAPRPRRRQGAPEFRVTPSHQRPSCLARN